MHACMDAYIHTYIPTYLHTYLRTYIHTYLHTYIHTYVHTYTHTYIHTYIPTYIQICTHTNIPTYQHTNIPTYQHTSIPPPQATGGGPEEPYHHRRPRGGGPWVGGEVAFPFEGALDYCTQHLRQAKRRHSFLCADSASLEPCGVRMYGMNSVIHVNMHEALCRHVKGKNKSQTDTNFLRVGTCKSRFTRSAQLVICCETVRRQKQNCTTCYSLYGRLLTDIRYKSILWT